MTVSNPHILQSQIDLISVPVFVADECEDGEFRIAAINSAHANMTGLDKDGVQGRTLLELVDDPGTASEIVDHYRHCIEADVPVSYRETIVFRGSPMIFDTTLQKIPRPNSRCHRIVGTALKIEDRQCVGSDIEFYVSLLRNSLTTIEMLMSAGASDPRISMSEREATLILCRKALYSLDDIGNAAARIVRSELDHDIELADAVRDLLLH